MERRMKDERERTTDARQRRTTTYLCCMPGCMSQVKRPKNHLRQTHKIKDASKVDYHAKKFTPIVDDVDDDDEEDEDTSDCSEASQVEYIPFFTKISSNSHDPDWAPKDTTCAEEDQDKSGDEGEFSEDDSESDMEGEEIDEDTPFVMVSPEEDVIIKEFQQYLMSVDCGFKSERDARKNALVISGKN